MLASKLFLSSGSYRVLHLEGKPHENILRNLIKMQGTRGKQKGETSLILNTSYKNASKFLQIDTLRIWGWPGVNVLKNIS
jgi:hypothetical protein